MSAADSTTMQAAVRYLSDGAGCQVVPVSIDGRPTLAAFEPDLSEHHRREDAGIGAVLSRRLLHALWSLPYDLPWPASALEPDDLTSLVSEGAGVAEVGDCVLRRYMPPGLVRAVGVRAQRLDDAVRRVAIMPPIFLRYAIASSTHQSDETAFLMASSLGVGAAVADSSGLTVHTEPGPAEIGVPGVYRWWLAELAYAAWVQLNVH